MEFDPKVEFLFTFYFYFLPKSFVPRIMYVKFPKKIYWRIQARENMQAADFHNKSCEIPTKIQDVNPNN